MIDERLGTVLAGSDGYALGVQQGTEVVGVGAIDDEADHAGLSGGGSDEPHARNGRQGLVGGRCQRFFMGGNGRHSHALHPIEGGAKSDGTADVRGASFELERDGSERCAPFQTHLGNHFAPSSPRRHVFEDFALAVQHADACGAVGFVPTEHEEVAVEGRHIDLLVRSSLGAVNEDPGADAVCGLHEASCVVYRAEGVRDVGHRHQLRRAVQSFLNAVPIERTVLVDFGHVEVKPAFLSEQLPRNDVRVVFHAADEDAVAGMQVGAAPSLGHEVDAVGGALGPDDFLDFAGVQKGLNLPAGAFKGVGGALGEGVNAPVDVRVIVAEVVGLGVDDRQRFLG